MSAFDHLAAMRAQVLRSMSTEYQSRRASKDALLRGLANILRREQPAGQAEQEPVIGRPKGTGLAAMDAPLVAKMRELLSSDKAIIRAAIHINDAHEALAEVTKPGGHPA